MNAAGPTESDVLNFALNLEYLEAGFYLAATTEAGLTAADTGVATGPTTGGGITIFTDTALRDIARAITTDELAHLRFLGSAVGTGAVPKSAINLAALGDFSNDTKFLTLWRAFEDTGVSAYAGADTLLTGNNLQAAAHILATEALHTGNVRLKVIQAGLVVPPLDALDVPPAAPNEYFTVDQNAWQKSARLLKCSPAFMRVLRREQRAADPNGMNGAINTV